MSPRRTRATALRILAQLRHDPRTIALLVLVPSLLMVLLRYVFDDARLFDRIAPALLGVFPFFIMFLVTSITTLRERTSGTLERLMTLPIARLDLLFGYALAFGLVAIGQVAVVATVSLTWLGLDIAGSLWMLLLIAALDALLGTALGLSVSALARTEFQAVQFMPLVVLPQVLLGGLFIARDQMAPLLEWISYALPLTYAIEAMTEVAGSAEVTAILVRDLLIVAGAAVVALLVGAATLQRRTP